MLILAALAALAVATPPLTATELERMESRIAARQALEQLADQVVAARRPAHLAPRTDLTALELTLRPEPTRIRGLCRSQVLRLLFTPLTAEAAEPPAKPPILTAGPPDLPAHATGVGVDNRFFRTQAFGEQGEASFAERNQCRQAAPSDLIVADDEVSAYNAFRYAAQIQGVGDAKPAFEYHCARLATPCADARLELSRLRQATVRRVEDWSAWFADGHGFMTETIYGSLPDNSEWRAIVLVRDSKLVRVELSTAPSPVH